jgi:uncharacterized protein
MNEPPPPESLLPYDRWAEEALRAVVRDALAHVAAEGLPGEHHFYVTFRTDAPGVVMPTHLRARFPQEITIVLQNKFWDLAVDRAADRFSVGLSFGGVPATLSVPFGAVTGFADPHVNFGLRFEVAAAEPAEEAKPPVFEDAPEAEGEADKPVQPQVVSLDAFRRKRD